MPTKVHALRAQPMVEKMSFDSNHSSNEKQAANGVDGKPSSKSKTKGAHRCPPIEHRIPKGKSGNYDGRPPKPKPRLNPEYAKLLIDAFEREVPQEDGSSVSLIERVVLRLVVSAAKGDLRAQKLVLAEYQKAKEDQGVGNSTDMLKFLLEFHDGAVEKFEDAKRRGFPPPDIVPHPDHFDFSDLSKPAIHGPIDKRDRRVWEFLKAQIRQAVADEQELKQRLERKPKSVWLASELLKAQSFTRMLKRKVPKGWKWNERIWTKDGSLQERLANAAEILGS